MTANRAVDLRLLMLKIVCKALFRMALVIEDLLKKLKLKFVKKIIC